MAYTHYLCSISTLKLIGLIYLMNIQQQAENSFHLEIEK